MLYYDIIMPNGDTISVKTEVRDSQTWLVWCHGAGSSKDNDRADAVNALSAVLGASFAAFDFRGGKGKSHTSLADVVFGHWLEDVEATIAHVCGTASRIILMGHSRGAYAAAWVAAKRKHPNVRGVVMISAAFAQDVRRAQEMGGSAGVAECMEKGSLEIVRRGERTVITRAMLLSEQEYCDDALVALQGAAPILIIHGAQDETVHVRYALDFYRRLDGSITELVVLPGVDHRFKEREREVVSRVNPFLERVLGS